MLLDKMEDSFTEPTEMKPKIITAKVNPFNQTLPSFSYQPEQDELKAYQQAKLKGDKIEDGSIFYHPFKQVIALCHDQHGH